MNHESMVIKELFTDMNHVLVTVMLHDLNHALVVSNTVMLHRHEP